MKNLKQEKGGATLFVLIAMLFFSMYLVGMYLATANLEGAQAEQTQVIKDVYEQGINNIDNVYEDILLSKESKLTQEEKVALKNNGIKELGKNEITNTNLKDNENIKGVITGEVPIPTGGEYKEGTKETGVVVAFGDSEFVWVPVPEISQMARLQSGSTANYQGVLYDFSGTTATPREMVAIGSTDGCREPDVVTDYDGTTAYLTMINNILGTNYTTSDQFRTALQMDYNEMVSSVIKYKGFFVGRYETSLDVNKKAKSKVGVIAATGAEDSANTWYGFYAYQKKMTGENNYTSIKSHMIWGSNYDAMLRWALTGADAEKVSATGNAAHSGLSSVYETGKITIEGKVDRINNIYDLEGNGFEWTAEVNASNSRSMRGRAYSHEGSPSYRSGRAPNANDNRYCSRLVIYINSPYTGKLTQEEKTALSNNGIKELEKGEITNENLKDNENIKGVITEEVPIPTGAEYKEGTKDTGVVVAFGDSEFVWVPVPEISQMARLQSGSTTNYQGVLYDFSGTTATEMTNYGIGTQSYREPDVVTDNDGNTTYLTVINNILGTNYATSDQFKTVLQTDYNEMVASVAKYKGFFVGRYETSLDVNKKAKSKVGVIPATAEEASGNMWYGLYAYQKKMAEDNNYVSVKSHMVWGSNYDAMLRWALNGADAGKVVAIGNAVHDRKLTSVYETGKATVEEKLDRINNIYDLEGNGFEITAEADYTKARSIRGGLYNDSHSPSNRGINFPNNTDGGDCSRAMIYIK